MRRRRTAIAALALVLAGACGGQPRVPPDVARTLLDERQGEFFAALAARDADRAAGLFSDAAVLHVANMPPIQGRTGILEFYQKMFGYLSASSGAPDATHVSESGDMAYGVGRASNEFRGPDGPVEYTGKYVLVWQRLDGDWKIALYAVSSNQPDASR